MHLDGFGLFFRPDGRNGHAFRGLEKASFFIGLIPGHRSRKHTSASQEMVCLGAEERRSRSSQVTISCFGKGLIHIPCPLSIPARRPAVQEPKSPNGRDEALVIWVGAN